MTRNRPKIVRLSVNEVKSGFFINFSPEEKDFEKDIDKFLEESNCPPGGEGIKELLHNLIYEPDSKEKKANPIMDAIQENPEAIKQAFSAFGNIASNLINKKIFKSK